MSFLPIALLGLLLAGAALLAFAARPRPSAVGAPIASLDRSPLLPAVAVAVPLLSLLVWFVLRSGADAAAWPLTGVVLWLLVVAVARTLVGRAAAPFPGGQMATALALAAAALPVLWAGDARAQLGAVALFAVVWLFLTRRGAGDALVWPAGALLGAVLLLWASAIAGPWSALLALAAAAILLGIGSLNDGRDAAPRPATGGAGLLAAGLPAVVGAAVAVSALRGGALPPAATAAATAVGLLAFLVGLTRLGVGTSGGLARGVALALGGLVLVAGVWAGEAALLAAARLAVLAPLALALLPATAATSLPGRLPRLLPLAVIYLALAGLPPTVGFGVLSRLYAAWLPGGVVLQLVAAVLLSLWLAVVYQAARPSGADETASGRALWLGALPAALAALGLVQINTSLFAVSPLVWAALAAPAVVGVALGHFAPGLGELGGLLRESVAPAAVARRAAARVGPPARRAGASVAAALADAAAILEGENGLLFLLALLLLLLWIGR